MDSIKSKKKTEYLEGCFVKNQQQFPVASLKHFNIIVASDRRHSYCAELKNNEMRISPSMYISNTCTRYVLKKKNRMDKYKFKQCNNIFASHVILNDIDIAFGDLFFVVVLFYL